jgi:ribosomal protein S18 acetylase RimI-like enzyme
VDVSSLAFRTDLALLGFGTTKIDDRGDHLLVRTPDNPTYWWGNYLLLPAMPPDDEVDRWIERHGEEIPEAKHVALGIDTITGSKADLTAFSARGLQVDALTVMTAQRTHPPRSRQAAATNRKLTSDEDWAQSLQLTVRSNDNESGDEPFARAKVASYRRLVEDGHGAWFGAYLDDRLVAQMGLFAAGADLARFQAVETDPDFRRRGLAGGLLHRVCEYGFAELAASTLVMVADPDYVAIDLYRAVGFTDRETQFQVSRPPGRRATAAETVASE